MIKRSRLLGVFAALSPAVLLAEGSTPEYATAATQVSTALTDALSTIAPIVTGVVVAGIAIWLIPRAVRLIKHGFASGTGR